MRRRLNETEEKEMLHSQTGYIYFNTIMDILKNTRRPLTNEEKNDILNMIIKIAAEEYESGIIEGKYSYVKK